MTKKEKFMAIAEILRTVEADTALVEFCDKEIETLANKSANRKPTTAQLRSIEIANGVYEDMAEGKEYTVTDMMKSLPTFAEVADLTQSYANSIVKRLKDSGRVKRTEVKGRAYFSKVVEE